MSALRALLDRAAARLLEAKAAARRLRARARSQRDSETSIVTRAADGSAWVPAAAVDRVVRGLDARIDELERENAQLRARLRAGHGCRNT